MVRKGWWGECWKSLDPVHAFGSWYPLSCQSRSKGGMVLSKLFLWSSGVWSSPNCCTTGEEHLFGNQSTQPGALVCQPAGGSSTRKSWNGSPGRSGLQVKPELQINPGLLTEQTLATDTKVQPGVQIYPPCWPRLQVVLMASTKTNTRSVSAPPHVVSFSCPLLSSMLWQV